MHPQRKGVPAAKSPGQAPGLLLLQDVDGDDDDEDEEEGTSDGREVDPAGDGQAEDDARQEDEEEDEVEHGEPSVLGRGASQALGQPDGDAHEGDGEEEDDARDVEEGVAQSHVQGALQVLAVLRQRRQDPRQGRADVGAQGQRVHPLDGHDPDPDERRQGGGEDGAALQDHGHARAHQDGDVAREVGGLARQVGVDGLVDHLGQRPVQQRVEDLDDAVQRQEDDDEGTDQQDAARRAVAQV